MSKTQYKFKHIIYGVFTLRHFKKSIVEVHNNYIHVKFKDAEHYIGRFKNGIPNTPDNYPKDNWVTTMQYIGFQITEKKIDELA